MDNSKFPESCLSKSLAVHSKEAIDFGDGWTGWIHYLAGFGQVTSEINENEVCYIAKVLAAAKEYQLEHPSKDGHHFNNNCKRCGAALNVTLWRD